MKSFIASVPTGNLIREYLDEYDISQKELALRTGISEKHLSHVLNGTSRLTEEVALKLEKVLSAVPASYWLNYESKYREAVVREQERAYFATSDNLKEIAERFKFNEVFKGLGWSLQKQAEQMLSLLQISDFSQFEKVYASLPVAFMEDGGTLESIVIWLNLCREEAEVQNGELNQEYNQKLLKTLLPQLKVAAYSSNPQTSLSEARALLNRAGVYLVIQKAITNSKIRGALTTYKKHPAIYISLRFKTHDHTWFALMHEVGHLLLHYSSKEPIISFEKEEDSNTQEIAANQFAQSFFIDDQSYVAFVTQGIFTSVSVKSFAEEAAVHPGILVARLQHDGYLPFTHLNSLKSRFDEAIS
jgi:addiction module HigA family antidote